MSGLIETVAILLAILTVLTVFGAFIGFMRFIARKEKRMLNEIAERRAQEANRHA